MPRRERDEFRTMCFIEGLTGEAFLRDCMRKFSTGKLTPASDSFIEEEGDQVNVSVRLEADLLRSFKIACKAARLRQCEVLRAFVLDAVSKARAAGMSLDIRVQGR